MSSTAASTLSVLPSRTVVHPDTVSTSLTPTTTTPLPLSTTTSGGWPTGGDDGGVIAGAVMAIIIILVVTGVIATTLLLIFMKRKNKPKPTNGPLWYIKTSPRARRQRVSSYMSDVPKDEVSKCVTPDFLVVRHKNHKSTVPNGDHFFTPQTGLHGNTSIKPSAQRWSERSSVYPTADHSTTRDSTPPLSNDDATLPRHIRSSSTDTDSIHPFENLSTATSSLSRPGKSVKVYQMPFFEDDNIIPAINAAAAMEEREQNRKEEEETIKLTRSSKSL